MGFVVPSGIYSDLGTKELREMLLNEGRIELLVSITNGVAGGEVYFPDVHRSYKICMLIAQNGVASDFVSAVYRIDPKTTPSPNSLLDFVSDSRNFLAIPVRLIEKLDPENHAFFEFTSQEESKLVDKLISSAPSLGTIVDNAWNPDFVSGLHKTNHRNYFNQNQYGLPIYEGKNLAYFSEQIRPIEWWIVEADGGQLQADYPYSRFGFRRIASSTNERTLVVSCVPAMSFNMYTLTTIRQGVISRDREVFLAACMSSYVLDFLIRLQTFTSVAIFNVKTLPVPRLTAGDRFFDAIVPRAARLTCTSAAFADLWQAVMGEVWTPASGVSDAVARQSIRDELDALVAHLYGLSRADFAHILAGFPLVFPDDASGRAKKEALLRVYDRMKG